MSNAPASSYRANVLPNVDGTNDRGGLSHGDLPESEVDRQRRIFDRKTTKFEELGEFDYNPSTRTRAEKIDRQLAAIAGRSPHNYGTSGSNPVSRIVDESLNNRLDALNVTPVRAGAGGDHREVQRVTGGDSAGSGSRHKLPRVPISFEDFRNSYEARKTAEGRRDYVNKVAKDVLPPELLAGIKGGREATKDRYRAIEDALNK